MDSTLPDTALAVQVGGGQRMLELAVASETLAASGGTAGIFRTTPAGEATPRTAGFTLFLLDVKEALAAWTLTYTPIPTLGGNIVTSRGNPERILAAAGGVGSGERELDGGTAYSKHFPVERLFRDARIGKNIPVAEELVLAHIGTQVLGLPRSY